MAHSHCPPGGDGQQLQGPLVPNPMDRVSSESVQLWDPKDGELYLITVKPWETAVEAGHCLDVQIV